MLCIELAGKFDEGNLRGVPQAEAEGRAVRRAKARADVLIGGVDLVQAAQVFLCGEPAAARQHVVVRVQRADKRQAILPAQVVAGEDQVRLAEDRRAALGLQRRLQARHV